MSAILVVLAAVAYLYVMFSLAFAVDRSGRRGVLGIIPDAWVYALSLAVYCTSWTFFGSVGRSASSGLGFLPVYIGPILVFTLAQPFLRKLLTVSKAHHITSIADLIAARYGKRQSLAALVTVIAVVGIVPYISLQLKAVAATFNILRGSSGPGPIYADSAFYLALLMAAFVVVFGTRRVDSTEQHRGMVATIAFESIVKLAAFLAVGIFVTYGLHDGFADILGSVEATPSLAPLIDFGRTVAAPDFWTLTFLSALVIFCLPRQFQVTVVENTDPDHLRQAAWMFPLYLVLINIFVLPIAMAGLLHIREFGGDPDTLVLTLPLGAGQQWLALFAFIGGFSAATGMIIVETIALSTMVSNSLLLPALIRGERLHTDRRDSVVGLVKWVRRASILGILLLAYAYVYLVGSSYALVTIGLVSFVAAAQFAPAIVGGLYWRRADWRGALFGLLAGFAIWLHTLLVPSLAESGWIGRDFLAHGPFGIESLRPYALFGFAGLDRISHSLFWSLLANVGVFVACSYRFRQNAEASALAASFVEARPLAAGKSAVRHTRWADVARLLERFLGAEPARLALAGYAAQRGYGIDPARQADGELLAYGEKLVAGVVGSSLARVVVTSLSRERQQSIEGVMNLLDDASEQIEVQWERLHAAVENINQGLAMFDRDLRLVVWNQRFLDIFGYPPNIAVVGISYEDLIRHAGSRQADLDVEAAVQRNLSRIRAGVAQQFERQLPGGLVIEVQETPLPNGGFVSTYTDISERKRAERALQEAKQELERRVEERTAELKDSERRFRDFAESSSDWLWETDAANRLSYLSERAAETLGVAQDALLGHHLLDLANRQFVEPQAWKKHCEDVAARRPFLGFEYPVGESPDALVYIRVSGKPVFDDAGVFLGYRGTATDVTVLINAQHELLRHEKLSALGGLVAGVAHEINTPVGIGITAASHLAERSRQFAAKYADGQMKRSDLEAFLALVDESTTSLHTNLTRAASLVRSFKQVAVDQSSDQARRFNVAEYVGEILDSLRPKLKRTPHTVDVDCPGDLVIESYPGALSQILANLVINSLQHGLADDVPGRIEISVRLAGRSLTIVYRDDGRGMPSELAKRIFEPFFTTRRSDGGSGLGMHIVYNLVTQKLRGRIACITAPGKGIMFTMVIPVDSVSDDE